MDFEQLLGSGILHTKMWIIDKKHVYVGSANMDWRALTQIKELGFLAMDCPAIALDLAKIFDVSVSHCAFPLSGLISTKNSA